MGESLTTRKVQQLWQPKVTMAESTKAETGNNTDQFVSDCLKVYDKLLIDPYIDGKLDNLEAKYGLTSCLNNLAKLRIIVEKTDNLGQRRWVVAWLEDALTAGGSPALLTNDMVT